jgi:hypothetical protein
MFSKRVKLVRDLHRECSVAEKKITREVSKFNEHLEREIKKKFRRTGISIQIGFQKVEAWHFVESKNRKNPLVVYIESMNGRWVHQNGWWASEGGGGYWWKADNDLTVEDFRRTVNELSEDLGIDFRIVERSEPLTNNVNF